MKPEWFQTADGSTASKGSDYAASVSTDKNVCSLWMMTSDGKIWHSEHHTLQEAKDEAERIIHKCRLSFTRSP